MWSKIQFVKNPRKYDWALSHCQAPTGIVIDDNRIRVFCASRNGDQESSAASFLLERKRTGNDFRIISYSSSPHLSPGPIGYFDEHGVFPSCILKHKQKYFMYYIGWCRGAEQPMFYSNIGLAISDDGVSFNRYSSVPIMGRSEYDPCLVTAPHVYKYKDGWQMNYVSGYRWERDEKTDYLKSFYHIKSAYSTDLINWHRQGTVAIELKPGETNIARPSVLKFGESDYRMWYSYVHHSFAKYRIGYAVSSDGVNWIRRDEEAGINIDNDQAKEMICYPHVFRFKDELYMLYNGDNFGQEGFGIAKWVA